MGLALGRPLMPWQQYVADVATERLPDPARCGACAGVWIEQAHICAYAYQVVVVSVPRQSGKTVLIMVVLMVRCVMYANHQALYTAQTGKDARARWQDLVKLVTGSPLRTQVRVKRSQGNERLEFPNGSMLGVFAPTSDSLHGYTPPTVVLDEAFAHSEDEGADLLAAIEPAQQTLPHRQLWLVSTRGTALSSWFHAWIERGCAGSPGVAVFDWGAADHHDTRNPDHVLEFHPAVGLPDGVGAGVTVEAITSSKLSPSEYDRAYGNRETVTESRTIPADDWSALAANLERPQPPPGDAALVLTYDVAYDRSASTISATWRDGDGQLQHKLVRWDFGISWVAETVADYTRRWNVKAVASDDTGPSRDVTDQLRRLKLPRGLEPRILTARELTVAWGELLEHVRDADFTHDGDGHLADAAAAVVPRTSLDSAAPSRRYSPGDIAPLMACMVGLYVDAHTVKRAQAPVAVFA